MTDHPGNTSRGGKGGNLPVAFVLAAGAIAGAIYLGYQNPDWTENLFSPQQAAIQPPSAQAPSPAKLAPSFDAITADAGMLVAAGKAQPGATVLLQNGGQTLGETKADENGEWVMMLERPLPAGPYNLSLLSIDPKTQARVPGARSYALTIAPQDKKAPAQGVAAATQAGKARRHGLGHHFRFHLRGAAAGEKAGGREGREDRRHALGHRRTVLWPGHGRALRRDRKRQQGPDQEPEPDLSKPAICDPGKMRPCRPAPKAAGPRVLGADDNGRRSLDFKRFNLRGDGDWLSMEHGQGFGRAPRFSQRCDSRPLSTGHSPDTCQIALLSASPIQSF